MREQRDRHSRLLRRMRWCATRRRARSRARRAIHQRHHPADRIAALLHPRLRMDRRDCCTCLVAVPTEPQCPIPRLPGPLPVRGVAHRRLGTGTILQLWIRATHAPRRPGPAAPHHLRHLDLHDDQSEPRREFQAPHPRRAGRKVRLRAALSRNSSRPLPEGSRLRTRLNPYRTVRVSKRRHVEMRLRRLLILVLLRDALAYRGLASDCSYVGLELRSKHDFYLETRGADGSPSPGLHRILLLTVVVPSKNESGSSPRRAVVR